jgi:hypothetical protein
MHQAVDVSVETDKDAKVGDRLNATGYLVALLKVLSKAVPRVLETLLDA